MRGIRLVIADQHPIVLQGLVSVLAAQRDFEIVASCSSGTSCVEAIRNLAPDIALLEDSLPDVTASEILAIVNAENLSTRLVFFTASGEHGDLAAAIAAGACGEISKSASPETLLQSLRRLAEAIRLLPEPSPNLAPTGKEANGANIENMLAVLTDREREIMRLVSEGLSNKEVARQLNVSLGTVKVHLHNIYQKLEINNRTVLAALSLSQRYGGFGALALTALTFATMSDVQAADPNATLLDDDSIAYKDLEHGAFELWTKEPVPRHIIVEDPGETVVLTKRGSSVSVNQVANSAARMEELQAAQQAVLANFAKGYGPNGSSTPYFFNPPSLQPINYTQTDGRTPQGTLPPLEFAPTPIFELLLVPPPPPVPPSLNAAIGPVEIDTVVFDTFSATTGTFTASSPRASATLIYGISGGTTGDIVLNGATYDVSKTGLYGTLHLNSRTGAYIFVPNSNAINALKADTTQSFIITVSDGTLSASETFTISIHGVDDAAIISGTTTGSVIEIRGVVNATPGTQTVTGTLTDTDVDDPPNTFTAVSTPTKSAAGYGTFTITAAGVWTYTLDDANPAVRALNVGGTLTDTFTVTSIDGTQQVMTITIHGPLIAAMGTAPSLTLSETHLTATALDDNIAGSALDGALTTTSGNFSTAFTSVQGVDGATISYALSITGGNGTASGLLDSHTGQADVLVLNGDTIEGHVGTPDGALAFTITVDPTTGVVTFTEYRAVTQPVGTNPDGGEGVSLTPGIVNLTATVIDKDGNFQTASLDLGSRLTLTDDGPMIAATGTAPSLTLSETHLTATALDDNIAGSAPDAALTTASGNFSTAFTSVLGADGATISYALSITGGNGTASGLIDSHTGLADVLVLNGNTIEGHVGATDGALAFTITLDPTTGLVTFTEYRAVTQPFGTNPDSGESASLSPGVVNLTATITDKDGDLQTASLDLGSRLTITDDGPTIGGFSHAIIVAQDGQVASGTFDVSFGADGDGAMRVAVRNGTVNGFNLATTDLGGGITSVHVTGNGDDYTFYYTTHAVNGGVELNAFFTDAGGTLSDPFFTLLINPDGTYTFDVQGVGFLQQTTVTGSDFGASSSGQPSLTAPDGLLVIAGDFNGASADVKASNNGIAVGDSGLQMDQHETLLLSFTPQQTDVSFNLTQWQGNGTADVVFTVYDGATAIHQFSINIPKPSGDARIVVKTTSNPALVNTYTFDSATSTYTLYVGSEFNQIGVSYDHEVIGNATFTVNNITYSEGPRIPSTDLLFDVTAVDRDGDTSTTSLQVDLVGSTSVASSLTLSASPPLATDTIDGTNDAAIISVATTGSVFKVGGTTLGMPVATGTLAGIDVDRADNTLIALASPERDESHRTFMIAAAGAWTYTLDHGNSAILALDAGQFDTVTDFISGSDKINLAAFGALAFMALSPTATSVPPHTIAWIYDTANNETIVYINPSDQALDIGDKALLEIHLQGTVSVAELDFVFEHATAAVAAANEAIDPALQVTTASDGSVLTTGSAEASVDATVSEGAQVTHDRWTVPSGDDSFHFALDRVHSTGSVRLASFGEAPASASEESDGDAATALTSVASIELPDAHSKAQAADHVTFDQGEVHASAGAMATAEAPVTSLGSAVEPAVANATATLQLAEHAVTPGNSAHGHSQHASHTADAHASAATEVPLAELGDTPGNSAGHGHSQHASHAANAHASAATEVPLAELGDTPGNSAGHGHSQQASHAANAHASAATEVPLAELNDTPGNSTSHGHSQQASHAANAHASAATEVPLAELGDTPGNSASHGPPQHASHLANAHASTATEVPLAELNDTPGNSASHGQSQDISLAAAEPASAPEHGQSFHFKTDTAGSEHSGALEVAEVVDPPALIALADDVPGPDGSAPEPPGLALAQHHGGVGPHHAAVHGQHELIV